MNVLGGGWRLNLSALCETNLKGNGEFVWNGIHRVRSNANEGMKTNERVDRPCTR